MPREPRHRRYWADFGGGLARYSTRFDAGNQPGHGPGWAGVFCLLAGSRISRTPGLGATTAAKESLKWIAMPSSGAVA